MASPKPLSKKQKQKRQRASSSSSSSSSRSSNVLLRSFNIPNLSPTTLAVIFVALLCLTILAISRQDCFHVHHGLSANMSDLEVQGTKQVVDGYIDVVFRAKGKILYDKDALNLLEEHPEIKLDELDLGLVYTEEQFGASRRGVGSGSSGKSSVGKSTDETIFRISGERIRRALRIREAKMPQPSK